MASLIFGLWVWSCALQAASPVVIDTRHKIGMPPFYPTFVVKVEPHELNRKLCIRWGNADWDPNLWDVSCRQLDGLAAQKTYQYPVSNARVIRETGEFILEAELIRSDKTYKSRVSVFVGGIPTDIGGFSDGP